MPLNLNVLPLLFILFFAGCGGGSNASTSKTQSQVPNAPIAADKPQVFDITSSYQELLDQGVVEGITGISLYIETPSTSLTLTSGVSNLTTNEPLLPDHLFRIASNTKSFVATIALQLSAEQRLNLSTPISDYLPLTIAENITNSDRITVKQLLSHTSGLYDYLRDSRFWKKVEESPIHDWSPEEMLSYIYQKNASFEPGASFEYSNSNYLILGLIIDEILGYDLAIEIRNKILEPLNMTETFYYQREQFVGELVHGYELEQGQLVSYRHINLGYESADGGMVSTPRDLSKLFQAFGRKQYPFNDGLHEKMIGETNIYDVARRYGLGMVIRTEHGENEARTGKYSYVHGGYVNGYVTKSHYYPEEGVTISYFVNRSFYNNEETGKLRMLADLIHTVKNKVFSEL